MTQKLELPDFSKCSEFKKLREEMGIKEIPTVPVAKIIQNIEDTIKDSGLPVNSKAMINRLIELLDEHGTNCLDQEKIRNDPRIKGVMWLLNGQVFGQLAIIDMCKLWDELNKEL